MSEIIFILSFVLLVYTWIGYYGVLGLLAKCFPGKELNYADREHKPPVSILISAYNETDVIEERIRNLLALRYPKENLEILIGSDGSTDETVEVVKKYSDRGVTVVDFKENRGRADVHNDLIEMAKGRILVFTDADTEFDPLFVENIVKPFVNPEIGATVGRFSYRIKGGTIAEHEGIYWKYELRIKELENKLGILNNGIGACMAFRKELFKPLAPVDDIDTATVIDIIMQGYKIFYATDALAYDIPPHSAKSEFKMRIRGTSKTLSSVRRRTNIWGWLKNPVLTWSLTSHRLLRYASPYFMVMLLLSNFMILSDGTFYQFTFIAQVAFYLFAVIGWIGNSVKKDISVASSVFSFCVAMSGMMIGVAKALTGNVTVMYKTDDGI